MPNEKTPKDLRDRERLTAHRGLATWGERLVPLGEFKAAAATAGRRLDDAERLARSTAFLDEKPDPTPVEGPFSRVAVFGGVYNNHFALRALLDDARRRGCEAIYCLGDLGGFGPNPEKVRPLLDAGGVRVLQGNYEESLASGREDCNCGYTDPRDNHFARVSYGYTERNCSAAFKEWMGELPRRRRIRVGSTELLLVHGSPRRINEFLFRSLSPDPFLEVLLDQERADGFLCTHTGLPWHRPLASGRHAVNVGVIGRPANDGSTAVRYAVLETRDDVLDKVREDVLGVEIVHLDYDHLALAAEMRSAALPEEFVDTITSGWWTTCLEILPAKERSASKF